MSRLWDKGTPLDERVLQFTAGEDHQLDERLVRYDVIASIAHARMLSTRGLITAEDFKAIENGLLDISEAHMKGEWKITLEDEDGQTALEKRLTLKIGATGGRVHLGRSRNDQVLTALRLYLKDAATQLAEGVEKVVAALDKVVDKQGGIALPGYTHMQQGMPSSVKLWAGGYANELRDDAAGLRATLRRIDKSPLGSAAGYGAPALKLDREQTAKEMGFASVQVPVTSVQLSRGKAESQLLFEIALTMQDLGRCASDLMLFYTQEFGFVKLPDAFTTGSSIMPQKRNPDVFELVRGRTATAHACLNEALGIFAKLPSGYQRDLQLLKFPLFRGIDICTQTLDIMAAALAEVVFDEAAINAKVNPGIHAADQAYEIALKEGIPFREAHKRVAESLKNS
ncbi:MAG TPA: argininosuccinate lyase [Steroidobacteraceae bacterium]|nr:argininosuccinate lyase [Steroidobacteraceae bacterium]